MVIRGHVFFWFAAGGSPGEGHLGVPAGAPAASGLNMTEPQVWLESRYQCFTELHRQECLSQDIESCCVL